MAARTVAFVSAPRGALPLFAGFALLFVATASYWRTSTDIRGTFIPAWELGRHHTINSDGYLKSSVFFHLVDGHVRSDRFPGAILAGVPAYAISGLFGGSRGPSIGPASITAALMTALSVVLFHRTLLRLVAPGFALAATLVFALGTATWAVTADSLWTHTSTQLGICMALYGIAANRAWWPLAGMALASAARPHIAVVALTLALGLGLHARRRLLAASLLAGAALGWGVILVWTRITFGNATILPGSYTGRGTDLTKTGPVAAQDGNALHGWPENIAGFLVSPERGVLVLTPILLLCIFGLRRAWPTAPLWTRYAALAGIVYSFVQLAGNYFAGGASFYSYRLAVEGVTLVAPLAALAARAMLDVRAWRRVAIVLVAYGFFVTAIGAIWYRPLYDAFRPWHYYRPYTLTRDAPLHGLLAVVIAVVLAGAVTAFVRSDPRRAGPGSGEDVAEDTTREPATASEADRNEPGGVGVYRRNRRISAR